MALGEVGKKFMEEHAREDERGVYHVTQKEYTGYMSSQGISKDILDAKKSADQELVNGMYLFGHDQLMNRVNKDIKDGGDGRSQKVEMSVNIPDGSISMSVNSHRAYPKPNQQGEKVDKVNVTNLQINQQRLLDKAQMKDCESEMKKKLGLL